jgi:subtilisin family serine protease
LRSPLSTVTDSDTQRLITAPISTFLSGTLFAAPFVTAIAAATYNSTPMRAAVRGQEHPFNPKGEMIGRMAVEKLGAGGPGTRDGVFGLGLLSNDAATRAQAGILTGSDV